MAVPEKVIVKRAWDEYTVVKRYLHTNIVGMWVIAIHTTSTGIKYVTVRDCSKKQSTFGSYTDSLLEAKEYMWKEIERL